MRKQDRGARRYAAFNASKFVSTTPGPPPRKVEVKHTKAEVLAANLASMTKAELLKLVRRLGLTGLSKARKPELIDAINEAQKSAA